MIIILKIIVKALILKSQLGIRGGDRRLEGSKEHMENAYDVFICECVCVRGR